VRCSGGHDLIAAGASVILLRCGTGDLADKPIAIRMTLASLATERVERSFIIAIITDAPILATHV
jgi:hypothetical protein